MTTSTHPQGRGPRPRTSPKSNRRGDDRLSVLLSRPSAEELADLCLDIEGDADEDLLDAALDAVDAATPGRVPQIPRGSILLKLRPNERDAVVALVEELDTADDRTVAGRVGERLRSLLQR